MNKNKRLSTLVKYLLDQKEPVTIKALSEMLSVSKRTIRYDLDEIEDFLSSTDFNLKRKPNYGIYIEGDRNSVSELNNTFDEFYNNRHFRSAEKRKYIILYRLFQKKEAILMFELSDFLGLSITTVSKDLDNVEKWLEENNLKLIRKRNYGVEIVGDELKIRHAMKVLVNETYESGEMIELLNEINEREDYRGRLENGFSNQIKNLLGEEKLKKLEKIINKAEKELGHKFTDDAYAGLVFHIAFAVSRLKSNKDITIDVERLKMLKQHEEFKTSEIIAELLENEFSIDVPEDEIGFITLHLLGARMRKNELRKNSQKQTKVEMLASQIIEIVSSYFDIDLTRDEKLFSGLLIHLKAALNRLLFDLPIENPLLDDIKSKYAEIFNATSQAARLIQNEYYIEISEEEIAYLTIHFGAALERLNFPLKEPAKVVIVCSSGVGTTNLLEVRLKKEFKNIKIIDNLSTFEVKESDDIIKEIDFIIATLPFKCEKKDVIVVKPFLDEDDIEKIKNYLKLNQIGYGIFSEKDSNSLDEKSVEEIKKLISPYIDQNKKDKVYSIIEDYFKNRSVVEEKSKESGLFKFIDKNLINLFEGDYNWKEAIELAGELLTIDNFIEQRYIKRMIEIVEEKGPYIAIAPHICLAHAGLEDGINKSAVSLGVFKKGFKLKHDFDPIHLVFVLAPEDKKSHLPALTDIMKIANNNELLEQLLEAENNDSIYNLIYNFLNN